jgi:hypothetical protein
VIFTVSTSLGGGSGRAAVLTLDDAHGAARQPGGSWRTLLDDAVAARVAAPGLLAFRRKTELFGVAWDDRFQALAGTPVPLQSGVGDFATSASGALVAAAAPSRSDRAPAARLLPGDGLLRQSVRAPADSRDAGVIVDGARADVWIVDAARGAVTRVTHDGTSAAPAWSPDGRMLAYASRAGGAFNLYARAADGSGDPRRLTTSARHQWPSSFTPDGAALAFTEINTDGNADLWLLRLDGQAAARPILTTRFSEIAPAVSPDGRWLAYESDESGRWEVYLQPWQRAGPRSAASTAGGGAPRWSPDSRRLFYDTPAGPMVVSIAGGGPTIGAPEPAAPGESATERPDVRLVITLEWAREARTRVPPGVSRMTR